MSDEDVPIDATAEQAKNIVHAAVNWYNDMTAVPTLTRSEWVLLEAVEQYGSKYKGIRSS